LLWSELITSLATESPQSASVIRHFSLLSSQPLDQERLCARLAKPNSSTWARNQETSS
jgi:hypothetical protein